MEIQQMHSFPQPPKSHRNPSTANPPGPRCHQQNITNFSKFRITSFAYAYCPQQVKSSSQNWKIYATNKKNSLSLAQLREEPTKASSKKGTIAGAVALIIGTSIGSGILALPKKTSPAGLLPSSISMTICWVFLLIEAFLLVEVNVELLNEREDKNEGEELSIISIRTMAQETLGDGGGALATLTYVFLGYTSMIAYSSKSGEILYHLINIPEPIAGFLFTFLLSILIAVGGTRNTDQVNQWLTTAMIGLLLAIEALAVIFGGWTGLQGSGDWGKVPATIPVIIFSLAYHDLAPVLCAYLGGDLQRIRVSVMVGSVIPLLALLVWDAIALGLLTKAEQVDDPVELLMSARWSGVSFMVEAFSLLAIGTSLIGTLLGFSEFFKEQLNNVSWHPSSREISEPEPKEIYGLKKWWGRNKISFAATAMVIAPSILVSTTVPDAFSAATDIAGGYCMTMLYGVLPPAMVWAMHGRDPEDILRRWPALIGVGLVAFGIIVEQVLQDLSMLHS